MLNVLHALASILLNTAISRKANPCAHKTVQYVTGGEQAKPHSRAHGGRSSCCTTYYRCKRNISTALYAVRRHACPADAAADAVTRLRERGRAQQQVRNQRRRRHARHQADRAAGEDAIQARRTDAGPVCMPLIF